MPRRRAIQLAICPRMPVSSASPFPVWANTRSVIPSSRSSAGTVTAKSRALRGTDCLAAEPDAVDHAMSTHHKRCVAKPVVEARRGVEIVDGLLGGPEMIVRETADGMASPNE